jgi:2-desacetyl-2-hydroxyethyl bacteriochlorophyllide A dehydrogenase
VRAFVVEQPGTVSLRQWPEGERQPGEVTIAPILSGLCGTDLELVDGSIDPAYVRYPLVLGHEWVGELVEEVDGVGAAGSRVVVEGVVTCGDCAECRRGATNRCALYDEIGFTRPGALAERVNVPAQLIHRLNDDVALRDAVLVEPMAVVWRALTRLPIDPRLSVVVIGDGTIALLAAYLVRRFDPQSVTVLGRREEQRDLVVATGADEFVTTTPTRRFDLVIEAAGTASSVSSALELGARGAMIVLLGLPPHGTVVEFAPDDVVNDDLIVQGSFSYTREAFADVVALLNGDALHPSFLVTHEFTLDHATDALSALHGDATGAPRGKVVVSIEGR